MSLEKSAPNPDKAQALKIALGQIEKQFGKGICDAVQRGLVPTRSND